MTYQTTGVRPAQAHPAPRTGPVGRTARLLLAAALAWAAYDLWRDRTFIFAEADPGLLVLSGFAVYGVHHSAALVGRGRQALAALAGLTILAAAIALMHAGMVWAAPLTWLVWGLDLAALAITSLALLVAVVIGTPGCESGVFRELTRRRRHTRGEQVDFCLAGLHRLDAWEAHRPWHRHRR
jgi:hypothetical protein